MLGWLANQTSSPDQAIDTLGSARAVRALIAQLEAESPQYTVDTLAKKLKDIPPELLAKPQGCRALLHLDEWAQSPLEELWESLVADSHGQTVSQVVWSTLTAYYRRSYASYAEALARFDAPGTLSEREQSESTLVTARAMAALTRYMLLQHMRYLSLPEDARAKHWSLIGWAERYGCWTESVELYPGAAAKTTIKREFLTALLIEVAPTAGLLPGQLLALEHLLRGYANHFRLAPEFDAQANPFVYDPTRTEPPERWLRIEKVRPGIRFFGVGSAYVELCKARDLARSSRDLPQWLARTRCSEHAYAGLLDRIVAEWSLEPPRRRHRREPRSDQIMVAHNFHHIRCLLRFSELAISGRSLAYDTNDSYRLGSTIRGLAQSAHGASPTGPQITPQEALATLQTFEKMLGDAVTEPWTMNDFSASGLGATAESDCAWVTLGMLVAYRRRESVNWHIAFVRRLSRSARGSLSIGMARLRTKVCSGALRFGAQVKDFSKAISNGVKDLEYDALRLQEPASTLLLPVGVFDLMHKYTLSCEEREQVVMMKKSLDHGPNFEHIEIAEVDRVRAVR